MLLMTSTFVWAADAAPLKVVASFSVLGDMVRVIGGDHIALTTIVGPNGDAHTFEPTPKDARALSQAKILVVNGLGFETWMPRLVAASGFKGQEVVASKGVTPRQLTSAEQALGAMEEKHERASVRHRHGRRAVAGAREDSNAHIDPHAWQSLSNGLIYVQNITAALAAADPQHADDYKEHARMYMQQIKLLDARIKQSLAAIPEARRKIVTSHDAFGYFGQAYGVQFISTVGISNEAEPSAKEIASIIRQVKREHVPAVFIENISNSKLIREISRETGAKIGGILYSDALAAPDQPAGTYLGMFEWNAGKLIYALDTKKQ
ncbi:MAG: metal ABC transporter substrate-binding protein [Candidimonas sp.]|nr:MAG: metal ABC transporter substrate-binding protein [Candidimonas sp.]TAM25309.1 MAG: metal ABC transporter substrate-binding protein [Candidimonas sp.]TAM75835.1 MAG: metal ABC transporter substrate-binding protein [Candidimonas sp.]